MHIRPILAGRCVSAAVPTLPECAALAALYSWHVSYARSIFAVSPELATLLQRLKTIYAITGGEVANEKGGKKDDFNAKKSMLIAQIHNFEEVGTLAAPMET